MQEALRSRLKADATLTSLVGPRIDWGLRPQGKSLPAITLTMIPTPRDYTMEAAQVTQIYRVQVDCWGATYSSAHAVRQAVIAELEPPSGNFLGAFLQRDQDLPEQTGTDEVHRASLDFKIIYVSA